MAKRIKFLAMILLIVVTHKVAFAEETSKSTLNVLFIGNSYTARHNLAEVVKAMAEEGNPGLTLNPTTVIYGGRTLADHWLLGTQNVVNLHKLTAAEVNASIVSIKENAENKRISRYAKSGLVRQKTLLNEIDKPHPKWDVVVLQSYRDDIEGDPTRYAEFAPEFAELARSQDARVVLYETTPTTQNAEPLTKTPDREPIERKAKAIAKLAHQIDASVAPMSLAALSCQTQRPDLTLRFINDAHLNKTMAYMTGCAIYAAIFDKSPVGLQVDSITDIRYFESEPNNKQKDRDGNPITRQFSERDRTDLQRFAWEAYQESKRMKAMN